MYTPSIRTTSRLAFLGLAMVASACARKDAAPAVDSSLVRADTGALAPKKDSVVAAVTPAQYTDENILWKEAAGDSAEVALATIARDMATSAAVKSYASLLIADHGKGLAAVNALAAKEKLTPAMPAGDTTQVETSHVADRLKALGKGAAFDSAFVNHEIDDHKEDIEGNKAMTGVVKNAGIKAFLQKNLPELEKHLDKANKIKL